MARRDYVSFLGDRRRDYGYYDRGPSPTRWLWLVTALALVVVSVWWFGFRDADDVAASERVLQDTTVPSVLMPVASGGPDDDSDGIPANLECNTVIEEWSTFQAGPERQGCVSTRRIQSPHIMWHTEIGVSGWLNNPVVSDGSVYVGSAGLAQFSPDRRDGIYALELTSGRQRWFYTTELDVNSVSVSEEVVVAAGDEGRIWAIDARDGTLLWTDDLQVGVYGSPLILGDMVVIGAGDGSVVAYHLTGSGERIWRQSVDGAVRGGPSSDGETIYVAGETHEVLALDLDGKQKWRTEVEGRGAGASEARIFAAPTITDTLVVISLVRTDVFGEPALLALDKETGDVAWRARDVAGIKATDWANIRSSPGVAGDFLVWGEGYSRDLVILDLMTGETRRSVPVGEFCYPHWPSVAINNGWAYLARHDGGLYAVDLGDEEAQEPVWDIYLGQADGTGAFPDDYGSSFCDWGPKSGFSILASPAVSPEGVIVVGSLEGHIMAVGDSDW